MREKLLHDLVGWCEDWVCLFYEFVLAVSSASAALPASTFIFSMQSSVSVEVISHSCDKISMFLSYHYIIHGWLCMWLHYVKCKLCILYVMLRHQRNGSLGVLLWAVYRFKTKLFHIYKTEIRRYILLNV